MRRLLLICLLVLTGCGVEDELVYEYSYFGFDTPISISVYYSKEDELDLPVIKSGLNDLINDLHKQFDNYDPSSDISRLNESKRFEVTDDFVEVTNAILRYSKLSDGLIDPTMAPVVELWSINNLNRVPLDSELDDALAKVDYRGVEVVGNEVVLGEDIRLDYGAVVKGYAADKIRLFLLDQGVDSGIINLGGNVLTINSKPGDVPFKVGVMTPEIDNVDSSNVLSLEVSDLSVVTSGINQRFFEVGDRLFHHIIDPRTGYPVDSNLASVTIITKESVDADLLSTYLFILGLEEGMEYVQNSDDVEAIFITRDKVVYPSSEDLRIDLIDLEYQVDGTYYEESDV